ncbi:MAG: hypothetical protein ACLGJC_06530 [Alphaproteobacteria bacterium]
MTETADTPPCPPAQVHQVLLKILVGFRRAPDRYPDVPRADASLADLHAFFNGLSVEEVADIGLSNRAQVTWDPVPDAAIIRACLARGDRIVERASNQGDFFGRTVQGDMLRNRSGRLL